MTKTITRSLLLAALLPWGAGNLHADDKTVAVKAPVESPAEYKSDVKVETLLQTSATVDGQPIVYPSGTPELRAILVELAPGAETGWHTHPTPSVGYILSGEISVEIKGKGSKTYRAGECLAETVNTLHNGTNTGSAPVRILMVVAGEQGSPTAVRQKAE